MEAIFKYRKDRSFDWDLLSLPTSPTSHPGLYGITCSPNTDARTALRRAGGPAHLPSRQQLVQSGFRSPPLSRGSILALLVWGCATGYRWIFEPHVATLKLGFRRPLCVLFEVFGVFGPASRKSTCIYTTPCMDAVHLLLGHSTTPPWALCWPLHPYLASSSRFAEDKDSASIGRLCTMSPPGHTYLINYPRPKWLTAHQRHLISVTIVDAWPAPHSP